MTASAAAELVDFDLDALRDEWVGRRVALSTGRYPVEHDPIRRLCHMVGDTNPLFLDPAAARSGPHGRVVVPLPLVSYFAGKGPWPRAAAGKPSNGTYGIPTPGDRGINMGTEWRYHRPAAVGDRLRAEVVIADVFVKSIAVDPLAVWIVSETRVSNQDDDPVMTMRNTVLVHRPPTERTAAERGIGSGTARDAVVPSFLAHGPTTLSSLAEVQVGDRIAAPERTLGWNDVALQVSGSQDWNRPHHDPDYARESGHRDIFFNSGWTAATLGRSLTDWIGSAGWLAGLSIRMRRMCSPGDRIQAQALVARVRTDDQGRRAIDLDIQLMTERQGTTTTGIATVEGLT